MSMPEKSCRCFSSKRWLYTIVVIMIALSSYQLDFVAHGFIFIVNKQQLYFLYKELYTHIMYFIFG